MTARFERNPWLVVAAILAAAGCGGSSGGSPPGGGGNPPGGPWLPYSGAGLFALDLAAPAATPVTIDSSSTVGGHRVAESGVYSATTGAVSGLQPHSAIWISAGKIWRASLAAGATPSAAQVSSEASVGDPSPLNPTANHLCDTSVTVDWATPSESRFFYTLAGSDKQCGGSDDVVKSTRLSSAAAEAPITVSGRRVSEIRSPSTGAITGWLLIDATGHLVRTDAALANPVQLLTSVGFAFVVGRAPSHQLVLLQSGPAVTVRRFDAAAGTLGTTALFTLPGGISSTVGARAQDDVTAYMMVFDGGTTSWSLYRLALAATQADSAVQMTSEAGHSVGTVLLLTSSKVAFTTNTGGTDALVAVDKTTAGTAAAPALGTAGPSGTSLTLVDAAADKVYVNAREPSRQVARAVDEAGTDASASPGAAWVGLADVGGTRTGVLANVSGSGNSGGQSLFAMVVGASSASSITLGTVPTDFTTIDRLHWSGGKGLLRGFTGSPSTFGEILFADAGATNSLVRVTSTSSVSESLP